VQLTTDQRKAVETSEHSLVSACPGAGKTRVLSARSARILTLSPANKVAAVTFTRDSANELRERIEAQVDGPTKGRLVTGTFHSIARRQLIGNHLDGKRLINGGEQVSLINRALNVSGLAGVITLDDAVEIIENFKSTLNPKIGSDEAGELYRTYQSILDREGMIDFADLLLLAVLGMRNGTVTPLTATHLLGDETQDMDEVQYAWIKCHAEQGIITTLVGDDDQSIYGWRHALGYEGMMRFKSEFNAEHITLAHNFRSDAAIIRHADNLIRQNSKRVQKDFVCTSPQDGIVETATHANEINQAKAIAALADDGKEWAVLARTNKILDLVELALISISLPYTRIGSSSLWDRDVAAVYLAFLESLANNNASGVGTVLHWAGIDDRHMHSMDAQMPLKSALETVSKSLKEGNDKDPVYKFVKGLIGMVPQWMSLLDKGRVSLVCGGVALFIEDRVDSRKRPVLERAASVLSGLEGTLRQRMAFVRRSGKKKNDDKANSKAKVTLMTMHASKGLEFDCVSVASCVEGVSPHLDSPMDEERRLMYVAMTRARHRLVLHSFLQSSDGELSVTPSRFLGEAGVL